MANRRMPVKGVPSSAAAVIVVRVVVSNSRLISSEEKAIHRTPSCVSIMNCTPCNVVILEIACSVVLLFE